MSHMRVQSSQVAEVHPEPLPPVDRNSTDVGTSQAQHRLSCFLSCQGLVPLFNYDNHGSCYPTSTCTLVRPVLSSIFVLLQRTQLHGFDGASGRHGESAQDAVRHGLRVFGGGGGARGKRGQLRRECHSQTKVNAPKKSNSIAMRKQEANLIFSFQCGDRSAALGTW